MDIKNHVLIAAEQETNNKHVEQFALAGFIDGQPVFAEYDGVRVRCARRLWDRGDLLVAMGESFSYPGVPGRVHASLEHPGVAMLLTFARACDRVVTARLTLSPVAAPTHPAPASVGQGDARPGATSSECSTPG